jgi:hypothetical protein
MIKSVVEGIVKFRCPQCERIENGVASDTLISKFVLSGTETIAMYDRLIATAAFDRCNNKVLKDCPECHLDYMSQLIFGESKVVIYVCKCGYKESV